MRIDYKDFYADIVKSEGGINYYVIQNRTTEEVIYCGQTRSRQTAVQAATVYLEKLTNNYYVQKLAS